jgi:predicted metalloprotease
MASAIAGFIRQARRDREREEEVLRRRREEAGGGGSGGGVQATTVAVSVTAAAIGTTTVNATATTVNTTTNTTATNNHTHTHTHAHTHAHSSALTADDLVRIEEALDPVHPYTEELLRVFAAFRKGWVRDEEYQVRGVGEGSVWGGRGGVGCHGC